MAATAASGRRLRRRSIWSTSTAAASWPAAKKCWAAKQQLIDEAFAGAAQRLSSLPQAEYIDLLAALAAENGSGDEELLLSAKDREAVGPQW